MSDNIYLKKKLPFWDYCTKKRHLTKPQVMHLSPDKKEILYLKWKHGMENPQANHEADMTDRYLVQRVRERGLDYYQGEQKRFWELDLKFDDYCLEVKKELGLLFIPKTKEQTEVVAAQPLVKNVMDKFGGQVEDWHSQD